ncbi:MAG: zinc ribbon domain-containing protein [Dehalococcoidia bacterium]|jgi:putative FmdB family regulatory protein|nr:zinc ribbon domain-containing protein [Dehalococcoidia bacterium]MDP7240374.1 zinc ribbon domain-containing protein [Dehalococcoidia bacterium]
MPVYEYQCCSCGHCFETKRGFGDTGPAPCPECEAESQKLFRPVPIIYKGSGFYSTDHRPSGWKGEDSKEKPAEKPAEKPEAKSDNTKTEAKKEDKAEAKST